MKKLTRIQASILEKMIGCVIDHNRLPTTEWVNKHTGVQSSTQTLRKIEAKGYIQRAGDSIRIGRWIPLLYPNGKPIVFKYEFTSTVTPKEWLDSEGHDVAWLADGVNVETGRVQEWLDGTSYPTVAEAAEIERFTLGGIPMRCWIGIPSMQRQGELV